MTDESSAASGPTALPDLDDITPPERGRAVAVVAIAAVLVLCFVVMVVRLRMRNTGFDGVCPMVASPTRGC